MKIDRVMFFFYCFLQIGKVLRIQKIPQNGSYGINGSSVFSAHELLLWEDYKDLILSPNREIAAQLYLERVMSPLLGSKHVDAGVCPGAKSLIWWFKCFFFLCIYF